MDNDTHSVGIVGLGSMGFGMARTLVERGFAVKGFDLSPERARAVGELGAKPAESLAEVFTTSGFVVLSLPAARDVEAVVSSNIERLEQRSGRRVIIIDTSTSEPDVSRKLAAKLEGLGAGFLDAPVSGGPNGAATGNLSMMIGGSEADVALARPVIEAMAAKILHVGTSGAGNVAKLVNNLLVAAHMLTTAEGLKLAAAAGLDPEAALRVVNAASGRSFLSEVHFPTWIMSDRFASGFTMGLMRKDVRLARELADQAGAKLPVTEFVGELWAASAERLADGEDFTRMGALAEPISDARVVG